MENQKVELHRVVVTAIIVKDGKFLIAQRSHDKKILPGMWHVPGGGMELDDYINTPKTLGDCWYFAIEKTLEREVMEEVGLEIDRLKYLLDLAFLRPDGVPSITLSFWCRWKSGEVKLNDESIDYKWVTLEEAKNYDLIPGIWGELEMVDKILKGEKPDEIVYNPK
ncbi:MAG: NUDIX domain-containing protein [Candidatus Gribaldobacteria bacterium]|nr:NUDIX domain-containing protein [Candidatus Gribaldobacteria bacterium]